jgi:hypothetical protein
MSADRGPRQLAATARRGAAPRVMMVPMRRLPVSRARGRRERGQRHRSPPGGGADNVLMLAATASRWLFAPPPNGTSVWYAKGSAPGNAQIPKLSLAPRDVVVPVPRTSVAAAAICWRYGSIGPESSIATTIRAGGAFLVKSCSAP